MKIKVKMIASVIVVMLLLGAVQALADEIVREFDPKARVIIETVSGDVEIRKGGSDKIKVVVDANVRPRDSFEPIFRDRGRSLRLEERIYESNSGRITWTLTVPNGTEIKFNSASGNMTIEDIEGEFSGSTASGDYNIYSCKGIFDLNTASGDYTLEDCSGEFDINSASGDFSIRHIKIDERSKINTASGDITGRDVLVNGYCDFGSASGDVKIVLGESPKDDIKVGSASGDASLDYNGNKMVGFFEVSAKRRNGHIRSDLDFDNEEEYRKNGQWYVRKTVKLNDNEPLITVGTASGRAELKK